MSPIPDRENLEEMTRTDIQKLCKDNNIKANMRTDEMINALCDLANGINVPRTQRSMSERIVSQPSLKGRSASQSTRTALQPSESNTDAESVPDAPTTRRKAKEIQIHLGKGRPAVAGGSGARNVTKASRGRTKASAMLQEQPIIEEEEENVTEGKSLPPAAGANAERPSSVLPPSDSHEPLPGPSQLPTPAPSQPSYSLPSVQLSALETRIAQLENPNFAARIAHLEASIAELPALKAGIAELPVLMARSLQVPVLQSRLDAATALLDTMTVDVEQCTRVNKELEARALDLEARVASLGKENTTLKDLIAELEARLRDEEHPSTGSIVVRSPGKGHDQVLSKAENICMQHVATPPRIIAIADPSPSQPTLGKRQRSDTPDVSDAEGPADKGKEAYGARAGKDKEREAIDRVIRPKKKKARLEVDAEDEDVFAQGIVHGGPSSTSTPRGRKGDTASTPRLRSASKGQPPGDSMGISCNSTNTPPQRSDSPSGFFTVGRRAPTPLARRERDEMDVGEYLHLDEDEDVSGESVGAGPSNANVAGPSNTNADGPFKSSDDATSPADAASSVRTPSPSRGMATPGPSTKTDNNPIHDPTYFGGSLPVFYTQDTELPYPLNPSTPPPPNAQDILDQSAMYATPVLGEPWQYSDAGYVNPANISQLAESIGLRAPAPTTPGSTATGLYNPFAAGPSTVAGTPGKYTFRGGRRERNDKYNPYFSPSTRLRTGLTPTAARGSLRSPAKMDGVKEGAEGADDGMERSPPQLRTLYGTELEGDTRFGDYGASLGKFDWGKYLR